MQYNNSETNTVPIYQRLPFFLLILCLIVVGLVVAIVTRNERFSEFDEVGSSIQWVMYENQEFDFTLQHPENWNVYAGSIGVAPVIHVYKENVTYSEIPFDHFKNVTSVSIFPHGLPVESIHGDHFQTAPPFGENVLFARSFYTENEDVWGIHIVPREVPSSWKDFGYIWGSMELQNYSMKCVREGEEVSEEICDPIRNDRIVRTGTLNQSDTDAVRRILQSFTFTSRNVSSPPIRIDDIILEDREHTWQQEEVVPPPVVPNRCFPTGCSNQICADQEIASTCEFRLEYACFQGATCERQRSGECGWTHTPELQTCIDTARAQELQFQTNY
jgi:hypothetical protein